MTGIDRNAHVLDKGLADELGLIVRETVREEVRAQIARQRRAAALYAASGTVALYTGAALALAAGLALAVVLPGWAAALIVAVVLAVAAVLLKGAARGGSSTPDRTVGHGGATTGAYGGVTGNAYGGGAVPDPHAPHHRAR